MSYSKELASLKTVQELYDFRDKMSAIRKENSEKYIELSNRLTSKELHCSGQLFSSKCDEALYFKQKAEAQILWLEKKGVFLNEIGANLRDGDSDDDTE